MISLLTTGCKIVWFSVVLSRTGVDWGFNNLCRSNHQGQVSGIMSVHVIHILLVATTCPHVWQKHVLSANQNSEFWQSNFKVYPPTLECFGTTPQTVEWKQSRSATHPGIIFVFGVLKIRMNEVYSSFLSGCLLNSPQKNTDSHFAIPQVRTVWFLSWHFFNTRVSTGISKRESCVFYLSRGFFKFFSFSIILLCHVYWDFSCFFSSMNLSHG